MRAATLSLLALLVSSSLAGCSGCGTPNESASETGAAAMPPTTETEGWQEAVPLIDALVGCDIDHRGLLVDMGAGTLPGRLAWAVEPRTGIVTTEHDGATWARIYERTITLSFYLPQVTPVSVSLRGIARDSSRITVSIDGFGLSTLRLARDEIKVATTRQTSLPLDAGLHGVTLRFRGSKSSDAEPYAEIDWLRIGVPDDHLERTYGAPTMDDVLDPSAQLAGVPHRAIALRAPATIRCAVRVPPHGRLRTAVGMHGDGAGVAAVVVRRDGEEAAILKKAEVVGGEGAEWTDMLVPLHRFAGQIVDVELTALSTTGTGRLLFGDPALLVPAIEPRPTPPAKNVVVVVLNGVERRDLPPWSEVETPHLPTFNDLARDATVFNGHRAPSTLVSAVVASLVTGRAPRDHTLADAGARLPDAVPTIGKRASDASVRAAMFTGVPTTFEPFGFATHWDKFVPYAPNSGALPSAPLEDAAAWLTDVQGSEAARPMLALIHARGGHPPWEITPPEAAKLPPDEYVGYLGPRRAAQLIAQLEGRHSRLSSADRERLDALFALGLSRQDQAIGRLIQHLKDDDRWDDTLFIVTGDVASARRTLFQDGMDMDEDLLTLPLYVHFPNATHGGVSVDTASDIYDVGRTALAALGISIAEERLGRDLSALASGVDYDLRRVRIARTDRQYSARWGRFVLLGEDEERPRLCDLEIDPICAYDRRHVYPSIAQALFRRLVGQPSRLPQFNRQPLSLDSEAAAMLSVWGAY
jgi:arylsulfatase A-like enzyme